MKKSFTIKAFTVFITYNSQHHQHHLLHHHHLHRHHEKLIYSDHSIDTYYKPFHVVHHWLKKLFWLRLMSCMIAALLVAKFFKTFFFSFTSTECIFFIIIIIFSFSFSFSCSIASLISSLFTWVKCPQAQ